MNDSLGEPLYHAEKILKKRIRNGQCEYLCKWKGISDSGNTWERRENIFPDELIAEFEKGKPSDCMMNSSLKPWVSAGARERSSESSFQYPEQILGALNDDEEIKFLVKWSGGIEVSLITSQQARNEFPQLVIDFFEKHLVFVETD